MEQLRVKACEKSHKLYQQMEYWSVYTFHPNITVLAALFRSGSPSGGTVFICENMSSLWQKCTRVPFRVV